MLNTSLKISRVQPVSLNTFLLNFGPQHPAAHGILNICLQMGGELVLSSDPDFGLLHSGSENLAEKRFFINILPYMDSMDYVANLFQEHAFVLTLESFFNNTTQPSVYLTRIIFDEFSSVLNHLLTMSAICLDMGAMGPIFWAFEESEQLMELFERVSGASMHTALYSPFGFSSFWYYSSIHNDILFLINSGSSFLNGSFLGLLQNNTLKSRLSGLGFLTSQKLLKYGVSGVIARASGISCDLSIKSALAYSGFYNLTALKSFISFKSDSLDSFINSSSEVLESFRLILTCLSLNPFLATTSDKSKFLNMEDVISHFRESSYMHISAVGSSSCFVEGPKGYVGVTIVNTGNYLPYSFQVRSPVAANMNLIPTITNNITIADFVATFCSLDVVLGEIDS